MSETTRETIQQIGRTVGETTVSIVWRQWAQLGAGALTAPSGPGQTMIDPEALLLCSLVLEDAERRLADFVRWWAEGDGARLLSVQRTKTLLKQFPRTAATRLGRFSSLAAAAGDRRWQRYADEEPLSDWGRPGKGAAVLRLTAASTLVLRLRAGFGVNAKADALAYLLSLGGQADTVQDIAGGIGYSKVAVRTALKEMVLARLIQETGTHPRQYRVDAAPWAVLLGLPALGQVGAEQIRWGHWATLLGFLAHSYQVFTEAPAAMGDDTGYLLSSRARDLHEDYRAGFIRNGVGVPDPRAYQGVAYLEGFRETIAAVQRWAAAVG